MDGRDVAYPWDIDDLKGRDGVVPAPFWEPTLNFAEMTREEREFDLENRLLTGSVRDFSFADRFPTGSVRDFYFANRPFPGEERAGIGGNSRSDRVEMCQGGTYFGPEARDSASSRSGEPR